MKEPSRPSILPELFLYIAFFLIIIICINLINYYRFSKAVEVLPKMPQIYEPVRFVLHSYADNSITARFWFYDIKGEEIGSYERSWPGYALALEIHHLSISNTQVSFPLRIKNMNIFSEFISIGTNVSKYYLKDGENILFLSLMTSLSHEDKNRINFLSKVIVDTSILNTPFFLFKERFLKTQIVSLESCEIGVSYTVRCSQGNAVIIR